MEAQRPLVRLFRLVDRWIAFLLRTIIRRPAQTVAGAVLFVLVAGTLFYHFVEGWRILDSAYFSVITLTTIGYGDFAPQTDLGKLFTIFYAFTGVGLLATYLQLSAKRRLARRKAQLREGSNKGRDDTKETNA